jgi:hypothetical protein
MYHLAENMLTFYNIGVKKHKSGHPGRFCFWRITVADPGGFIEEW